MMDNFIIVDARYFNYLDERFPNLIDEETVRDGSDYLVINTSELDVQKMRNLIITSFIKYDVLCGRLRSDIINKHYRADVSKASKTPQ